MALKISVEGNQIVFTDTDAPTVEYPYPQSNIEARYTDTQVYFVNTKDAPNIYPFSKETNNYNTLKFDFADVQDSSGVSLTTKSAIQSYLSSITGSASPVETSKEYLIEVAKGNVAGASIVHKFGSIDNLTTTLTPITTAGTYPTPTAATALEVISSSANDAAAGSGARTLEIQGLSDTNGSWTMETQVVTMNGTTAVSIPNSMFRVFRVQVLTSGTYATESTPSHNSTITVRVSGGGATWATITPEGSFGLGQSEIAVYSSPKGKAVYILSKYINIEGNKAASIIMFTRDNADTVAAPFAPMQAKEIDRNITSEVIVVYESPKYIGGLDGGAVDIGFMGQTATGTTDVSIDFELLIIDN